VAAEIFRGLNLFLGGVLSGGMLFELLVVLPMARPLPFGELVPVHRHTAHRSLPFTLANGVASGVAAIVVLILEHDFGHASAWLTLIGIVVLLCGAASTVTLYLPVYKTTDGLEGEATADLAADVLKRWSRAQRVRTMFYTGAFALFVSAAVLV
jgi:uncharacterized membrane protein